ncbi:MAG TPA: hypothetical protein VJT85_01175 [Gemmatimonadaceae bacterium]|nr:hypothetical protein [Gemmatimonadaceae bacterium]
MHRSRLSVLVIFAAVAACSTRDDSKGSDGLSQDPTLVAKLDAGRKPAQPLPDACGTVVIGAQPSDTNRAQAEELTRRAYDAEMQGNVQEARTLLRRASDLDATNKSAAYHLGLTSETIGDRAAAVTAYCRYLSLAPASAESAEARQRVGRLSQTTTRVAAGTVNERDSNGGRASATVTRRETRVRRAAEPRVVATEPRVVGSTVVRGANQSPARSEAAPASRQPAAAPSEPVVVAREAEVTSAGTAGAATGVEGEVVAASRPEPPVEQRPTPPTVRRGPNRAQSAGIGAAVGGIIGAATGRSVKSAIIGAAAGGIFGTAVGGIRTPPFAGGGI